MGGEESPKKGEAWAVCRFQGGGGGLARNRGVMFLRGRVDTLMQIMNDWEALAFL